MALVEYPPLQPNNWIRSIKAQVPHKFLRDIGNRLSYGADAPQSDETLYICPRDVTRRYVSQPQNGAPAFQRRHSGLIKSGDWDLSTQPLESHPKYAACRAHWIDGLSWEETGIFDRHMGQIARKGMADGCRTLDEVRARYARLDQLFNKVRDQGYLDRRCDLDGYFRREYGGIVVHFDRNCRPLRSLDGEHRFMIAHILDLCQVPVQVGVVHSDAVTSGAYPALRQSL